MRRTIDRVVKPVRGFQALYTKPCLRKTFIKLHLTVLMGNNMEEDDRLTIVRKRTLARMKKKTLKERIRAFVRGHVHMDDDKGALFKLKKSEDDPVVRAYTYDYSIERGDGARIKTKKEGGGLVASLIKTFAPKKKESFAVFGAPKKTLKGRAKEAASHVKHGAKKAVSHVKKHTKVHFSFAHNNPAIEYLGRWERKWHRALHVLSFLIPILILGYVIYMNILPFGYTGELFLDVGAVGDMDSSKDIYLSDPNKVFTPVQRYGKETYREVTKDKHFYLHFYAPIDITNRTRVTMNIDYEGNSALYIEYFDPTLNRTVWKRYYKDNYRPGDDGYLFVAYFQNNWIYAKESVVRQKCKRQNITDCSVDVTKSSAMQYFKHNISAMTNPAPDSVINWLIDNAKYDSVLFLSEDVDTFNIPNPVDYQKGAWTEIDADLRGTHQFYVYLNNSLNLTITKKDYNWYNGRDEVSLELSNLNDTMICTDVIPDDGITDSSRKNTEAVTNTISCEVDEGIYLLKLNFIKDTNPYSDYYIDKIKINTNKIVTRGTVLPVSGTTLYTNANVMSGISFRYWHSGMDQDIIIEGDNNRIIELTKNDISKRVYKAISGKNTLHIPKGDLYIYSNLYFSFNESNYFEPYVFGLNTDQVPEYIVYGGTYKSWIYNKNNIRLKSSYGLRINNIQMVFRHEPI